jgi:hypothetical protein
MTLHTFQGQAAGPVEPGQPTNPVQTVIIDPGTNMFEGNNPGLLYMAASRATTMGSENALRPLDSAIYWTGMNMNRGRIMNLTMQRDGQTKYKKVKLREKWTERLNRNTIAPAHDRKTMEKIKKWCDDFTMKREELEEALHNTTWRINMYNNLNY